MGRPAFSPAWLLLPLALLAGWGLCWGASQAMSDSADLWRRVEEVTLFVAGDDPFTDPDLSYPPAAVPVFTALIGLWPVGMVAGIWLFLNLAALVALGAICIRFYASDWPGWAQASLVLAMAASKPVRAGLALGQFHLMPTALALGAVRALAKGQPVAAGLMIGLAAIKPTMVLPLLGLWVVRRAWKSLGVAAGVQFVLTLMVSVWVGTSPLQLFREWLANARLQEVAGTIDLPTIAAQSIPGASGMGTTISLVALAGCLVLMSALRRLDDRALGALGLFLGAIFAYHRHYDLVLLLPPLAWLAEEARERRDRWSGTILAVVAGFGALLILPTHPEPLRRFAAWYDVAFLGMAYLTLGVMLAVQAGRIRDTARQEVVSAL